LAVAVDVAHPHRHRTKEAGVGQEAADLGAAGPVEDLDVAVGGGADDDVGLAIAVDVPGGHEDAALEAVEGEEGPQLGARGSAEDLDVPARRPWPGPDHAVGDPVAVDVAAGHPHLAGPAGERLETAEQHAAAVADLDEPFAAGALADGVLRAVVVRQ